MLKINYIIVLLITPFYFFSQSFVATVNNDTIYFKNLSISDDYLTYYSSDDKSEHKVEIAKVKGFYLEEDNIYYHKKLFNAKFRSGFLGLSNKPKDYFVFVELLFEGKINAYRSRDFKQNANYYGSEKKNFWFFEKGDSLEIAFLADYDKGSMKIQNARYGSLNRDFIETIFSDDAIALRAIKKLKKNDKLKHIRKIVSDYNIRYFKKNEVIETNQTLAEVIFLRDSRKEFKEDLVLSVDSLEYRLDRNTKVKLKLPTENQTLVCIINSENKYCRLVSSSESFPKFYKVILEKDKEGDIFKVNGLSSYYKVRLENYESVN